MSEATGAQRRVVGLMPWFPWPFSAWPWWTEPVRAERLALLRIGVALCLLFDIGVHYAPGTFDYFARDSLGDPKLFAWQFQAPRMSWSLLRGVGDEAGRYLSLIAWILLTGWTIGLSLTRLVFRHRNPPPDDRTGIARAIAVCAFAWLVAGVWSRMVADNSPNLLAMVLPLIGVSVVCFQFALELSLRYCIPNYAVPWTSLTFTLLASVGLVGITAALVRMETYERCGWWVSLLGNWQDESVLLGAAMGLWIALTVLLLVGCFTRAAAVMTWMFSLSFANANPYIDNAGDTIRAILLFYLMLSPCGAAWSVDAWRVRKRWSQPAYVYPWPIRLLFVQMICIYFMNGLYKLCGGTWREGTSLYYVLGDLALTRFSPSLLPLPYQLTRILTWGVMAWELAFPILVLWKWKRRIALCFGVLFHLGIFATMELGGFVPYALCMYLPLIPIERRPWANPGK